MLLRRDRFKDFTKKEICDTHVTPRGLFAISCDSRAEVDTMVNTAIEAGGTEATDPQDHGFMFVRTFYDLDGHHWEGHVDGPGRAPEVREARFSRLRGWPR
jgi:predicted lactoylglutathione lyase